MSYKYDAFISHNGADKPAVERVSKALETQGLHCFFDKWDILSGEEWLRNLETGLGESHFILIFIGTQGIGPWQQAEADAALRRQVQQRQNCIIPVLLPDASPEDIAKLSIFLQGINALRFHDLNESLPHSILAGLVRGDDPAHLRQLIREHAHAPDDLLQTLNYWLTGLHVEWREKEEEYRISEGQGKSCLRIPDLSTSSNPDSIEYLLNWKSRLTPMLGREAELKVLHDWADARSKISICLIVGEGGVGKTRLAFEFATQLKEKGWEAGEAQGLEGSWYTGSKGTLLVIDYPEQRPEKVTALLEAFTVMPAPERKLRVLLLGRNGDFLQKLSQAAKSLLASSIKLRGLAGGDSASWDLFQQAWQQLHELKETSLPPLPMQPEAFQEWRQRAKLRNRPLFIMALAIRLMLDSKAKELSGKEIIRVLTKQYEVTRLEKEAKKRNIDKYSLVMLQALAAMSGELESEALRQLIDTGQELKLDIQLPALRQLKDTSLWSQHGIHALQPDLLAADLLHYALTELAGDQSGAWQYLGLEAATDVANASSIFGRLIHDSQSALDRPWPLQNLIDWVRREPRRCEKLNLALGRNNLEHTLLPLAIAVNKVLLTHADSPQGQAKHLTNLARSLGESGERAAALQAIRRAVEIHEQLAKDNFTAYGPDLARSLNNLSVQLSASGERAPGLQVSRRAVEIYEQLAADNFAAYGPGLALGLSNLSVYLGESGERAAALQAGRRAVEILEQLAKDNFTAYGSDLARSLNNLSAYLHKSGERAAALQEGRRAGEIYEQLAADNFAAYGPGLARSLVNLSVYLRESGERAPALQAGRRVVEIYERLAADNFAAYGPDLARSLANLSVYLGESGERAPALQAGRRAVEIHERLAADNFAAYGPDLARSLVNLSERLGESGERAAALQAGRRGEEIYEQLAADNFATYGPDLAKSLVNLSARLGESGERAAALQAVRRGEEIYEQLAADNFAAYGPDLAKSLVHLSIRLGESGKRAAGFQAIRRAVEILEQLAKDNFAAYGPDLAGSLVNLSVDLVNSGERAAGLQATRRAVEIYEQLAADNFAAYGAVLALGLNNLSVYLGESGEQTAGLQAIRRAVEIYEQLAKDNFAAYGPDLARSLANLSLCLRESGEWAAGLQAIRRAVEIYEQLAKDNFAAYGPDLAGSLVNLSVDLVNSGEWAAGLQATRRAVEIYEQLAKDNFTGIGPDLARSLHILLTHLEESDKNEEAAEIKAKLETIKQRILDEQIEVPADIAWLFE
ncbi:Tetratricopeptide repeat-containing protein [Nitrosospira multiformis]|uniref:Tetratricopeptide repeat-containing protein n=1 Tax=Nitrosospira multiformis TaxID=1231 RepID=A0A1H8LZC5_9PROT|nr:tetratricopeptide repeat protein [Nitrosospira multiformis]SEO10463.1 Tetratricopeptide repeat-containing protein [Nitrosospira multiformis]